MFKHNFRLVLHMLQWLTHTFIIYVKKWQTLKNNFVSVKDKCRQILRMLNA